MKPCVVVVWYNPDSECVENIKTYNSKIEKLYVVDNSKVNNCELTKDFSNCEYIPLMDNLGIAKALNVGCEKAFADGFEWCMTMDQDSKWNDEQLNSYFSKIDSYNDKNTVSFAPNFNKRDKATEGYLIYLLKKNRAHHACNNANPNMCIASGNVIKLDSWNKVNGFNEDFFIDEVDYEFCYKLKETGYNIHYFDDIYLDHSLGEVKKTFLPRLDHNGIRLYYMIRNRYLIKKLHPDFFECENYKKGLFILKTRIILEGIFYFKYKNVYYMNKALKDAKNGKMGKYSK